MSLCDLMLNLKGGPGSGHHGHAGRKGRRGGSAPAAGGFFLLYQNLLTASPSGTVNARC